MRLSATGRRGGGALDERAHIAPPRSAVTVVEGGDSNLVPCSAQHRKARAIAVSAAIAARHTFADALGCHRHPTSGAWTARAAPGGLDDRSLTASVRERTGVVRRPAMVQLLELSEADAALVIEARDRIGGFSSPEEVIVYTDLSPALVDGIRERLVFLR
jgi:hypothetical protein